MPTWLRLDLKQAEYDKLVKYVENNMFLGIKRVAKNLEHIIIHSVGDALVNDQQDYESAEIFLEQRLKPDEIAKDTIMNIIEDKNWYLKITKEGDESTRYLVVIEKSSDFILMRK